MKNIWNDPRSLFNGNHFSSLIMFLIKGRGVARGGATGAPAPPLTRRFQYFLFPSHLTTVKLKFRLSRAMRQSYESPTCMTNS